MLSAMLSLVAAEGGARIYAVLTDQPRGMTADPELGWRPLPGISKRGQIWGVRVPATTNTHGWRDRERSFRVPDGRRRIVAIGDSFTFGVEADDGERFTDVLERQAPGLEVINLGVAGYGTDQQLRVLELKAARYHPSIVLLTVFTGNDLDDIRATRLYSWSKPYYTLDNGYLILHRPVIDWVTRARSHSYLVEFVSQRLFDAVQQGAIAPEWVDRDSTALFRALIDRIQEVAAAREATLLVSVAYPSAEIDGALSATSESILTTLKEAKVTLLDTRPLFRMHRGTPLYTSNTEHWNAAGHALVAEEVRMLVEAMP